MKVLLVLTLFALAWDSSHGKIFTRCELAKALFKNGFSRASLPTWVCIAEQESGLDSSLFSIKKKVSFFGLFQIGDDKFCQCHKYGGVCKMHCRRFLRDNVYYSAECAKLIYSLHGWRWWKSYTLHCLHSLPDLSGCDF